MSPRKKSTNYKIGKFVNLFWIFQSYPILLLMTESKNKNGHHQPKETSKNLKTKLQFISRSRPFQTGLKMPLKISSDSPFSQASFVRFHTSPHDCVAGFMRKVYSLLSIQLAITTVIGATLLLTPGVKEMVQVRYWYPVQYSANPSIQCIYSWFFTHACGRGAVFVMFSTLEISPAHIHDAT